MQKVLLLDVKLKYFIKNAIKNKKIIKTLMVSWKKGNLLDVINGKTLYVKGFCAWCRKLHCFAET